MSVVRGVRTNQEGARLRGVMAPQWNGQGGARTPPPQTAPDLVWPQRSTFYLKMHFFLDIFFVWDTILLKFSMNTNIINTQISNIIKSDESTFYLHIGIYDKIMKSFYIRQFHTDFLTSLGTNNKLIMIFISWLYFLGGISVLDKVCQYQQRGR